MVDWATIHSASQLPSGDSELGMQLDLAQLNHMQCPEFWIRYRSWMRGRTRFPAGDWDRELSAYLNWSAHYEPAMAAKVGMVPLTSYGFYTSLQDRFLKNRPWEETAWYTWILERSRTSPLKRYEGIRQVKKRIQVIEEMFKKFADGCAIDNQADLPRVNLGRNCRISIDDGRHRLCIAKVAGFPSLNVKLTAIHPDAVWKPGSVQPLQHQSRQISD